MTFRKWRILAAIALSVWITAIVFPAAGVAAQSQGPQASCTVKSYRKGKPGWLVVDFSGVSTMTHRYVAAASANAADQIFVQNGMTLTRDGVISLEGYGFEGRVVVLQALSKKGEAFLTKAQKNAASQGPLKQKQLDKADVRVLCDYFVEAAAQGS
jgi:hypothetical protein